MKPAERQQWILDYVRRHQDACGTSRYSVDVLNRNFVDRYVDATGAKAIGMFYGADKCPQLGRDLSALHADMKLRRHRTGIQGLAGMGFPLWVWSYYL